MLNSKCHRSVKLLIQGVQQVDTFDRSIFDVQIRSKLFSNINLIILYRTHLHLALFICYKICPCPELLGSADAQWDGAT